MSTPVMTCDACEQQCPWNPFACCSWGCFDTKERPGAPEAFAYFLGLGPPDEVTNPEENG